MGKKTNSINIKGDVYDFGVTSEKITVTGIENLGNLKEGDEIPAGTDLDSFLKKLLIQELWPETTTTQGTLVSRFTTPPTVGFNLSDTGKVENTVVAIEVGTEAVMYGAIINSDNIDFSKLSTPSTVTGFTNGYAALDIESAIIKESTVTKYWNGVALVEDEENAYQIKVSEYTGFGVTQPDNVKGASETFIGEKIDTGTSINESVFTAKKSLGAVKEGSNTITLTFLPPRVIGRIDSIPEYYIISNLNNKSIEHKSTSTSAITYAKNAGEVNSGDLEAPSTENENSWYKITLIANGKYRAGKFITDKGVSITSTNIGTINFLNPIASSGSAAIIIDEVKAEAGKRLNIVVPPGYSLSQVKDESNSFDVSISNFKTMTIIRTPTGGTSSTYTIYYIEPTVDTTYKSIKIKKN